MPKKIALAPFASFPLLTSLTRSQSVSHCLWSQSRVECGLISRNGHQGSSFDPLTFYLARSIPHQGGALLDSEIACVDASGRPPFDDLPFRRREPRLFAFDLLHLNGKDCRRDCLARRKVALNTC